MKAQQNKIFRYLVIAVLFLGLLRFFPLVVRAAQAAAIGVRAYWWVILPTLAIIWIARKMRPFNQPKAEPARDVTDSVQNNAEDF